jgi:hypothetical protein
MLVTVADVLLVTFAVRETMIVTVTILDYIGDDILMKISNVKINTNYVCNLISMSSEQFN